MSKRILCIYHGHCDDGFGAAWAFKLAADNYGVGGDIEFYPGVYQQPPPDCTGRDVVMLDFSYKRPVIEKIIEECHSLLVLDHHKTAAEDLAGLPAAGVSVHEWMQTRQDPRVPHTKVGVLFDMNRSGAGIAWDFFHNRAHTGERRPQFIDYLEDRDLWRKQLPDGDEFTIALRSYPQDFDVWDGLLARGGVGRLIEEGRHIQRYYRCRVEELKRSAYLAGMQTESLGNLCFWAANAPYFAASEVAGELAEKPGTPFGACYFKASPGRWQYSLRSRGDFDVSKLALEFGGGGHKNAAGFTVGAPVHAPITET